VTWARPAHLLGQSCSGWLSDDSPRGYGIYVRPFSIATGWLARPRRISQLLGNRRVWPGDAFGLSIFDPDHLITTWDSAATNHNESAIYAAEETVAASVSRPRSSSVLLWGDHRLAILLKGLEGVCE
jgi:hypothetical protein